MSQHRPLAAVLIDPRPWENTFTGKAISPGAASSPSWMGELPSAAELVEVVLVGAPLALVVMRGAP